LSNFLPNLQIKNHERRARSSSIPGQAVSAPEPDEALVRSPEKIALEGAVHLSKVEAIPIGPVAIHLWIRAPIGPLDSTVLPKRPV